MSHPVNARSRIVAQGPRPVGRLSAALLLATAILHSGCKDDGAIAAQPCTVVLDGACWTHLGLEDEWVAEIAVTPWGLFVGTADHGIFRLDAGGRWRGLGPEAWHDHLIPVALLYVPTNPPRLLVGLQARHDTRYDTTSAAVFASYDRGATWVPSDGGLGEQSPNQYRVYASDLELNPRDPRHVFMSNCNGVLGSSDGGLTWAFLFGSFDFCAWNLDILVHPDADGRLWVAGQGNIFNPRVAVSHDWGETWDGSIPRCNGIVYETSVYALALDPNRPERLWAGVSGGVMWTDDGVGARSAWQCGPGPRGDVVAFAELERALYAATVFLLEIKERPDGGVEEITRLGLYRTGDGGATWDSLPVPEGAQGATSAATDEAHGRILIGTRAGLWALTP